MNTYGQFKLKSKEQIYRESPEYHADLIMSELTKTMSVEAAKKEAIKRLEKRFEDISNKYKEFYQASLIVKETRKVNDIINVIKNSNYNKCGKGLSFKVEAYYFSK